MTPTQVAHPWRASLRTAVAVLLGLALVLPIVWAIIGEELGKVGWVIPEPVGTVVGVIIAAVTAAAAIVTRVMAIPAVSDWLTKMHLGPTPAGETQPEPIDDVMARYTIPSDRPPAELVPPAERVTAADVRRLSGWHDEHGRE